MITRYLTLLLLLGITSSSFGQKNSFQYKRAINLPAAEDWYSISLPEEIFSHLQPDFSDLRIFSIIDKDTVEIPYLLEIKTRSSTEEVYELPVFNLSRSGNSLSFTLELPEGKTVNTLHLDFKEKNFNAYVSIEGSDDRKSWHPVESKQRILALDNNSVSFLSTTVNFTSSRYRYLKVQVEADARLNLEKSFLRFVQNKDGTYHSVKSVWSVKQVKNQSIILIKTPLKIPVSQIHLDLENDNDFYRNYTLEYALDSIQTSSGWYKPLRTLDQGTLTSLGDNILEVPTTITNEIKLTVFNRDNPPLAFRSVRLYRPEIQLTAKLKPGTLFLFYGSKSVRTPDYDIVRFQNRIPTERNKAELLAEEVIPDKATIKPLFTDKLWLWGIIAIVIIVLGYLTIQMISSRK
ncbi:MAG: DUF3999 domain-containing protein [Cyclobacteriaceae bacterium]|nr:DUF3999 domain-containing protein [Cyclobacteriaceae bacterium]